jgi:multiple sugar transport system permease protein
MSIVKPRQHVARQRRTKLLTTGLLGLFLVYTFLPIFYLFVASTKDDRQLFSSFGLWFTSPFHLFANLESLFTFQHGVFSQWLFNTALYAVTTSVGAALICCAAGYAFAKFHFPARQALFGVILGSVMVPRTALVIPIFLLLSKINLVDTPLAVILPSLVFPLGVYLARVYAEQGVPDELLDAARIDGAGEARIFLRVALPIMQPAFVTVLLLSFVVTWNNYFLPLVVLSSPKYFPITVGLASWFQQASAGSGGQALFSLVVTGALVSVVPVAFVFVSLQRYWRGDIGEGAVK